MISNSNNKNTILWIAGLGAAYLLYKKYGNPLNALAPAPVNNLLALQLPPSFNQSYFVQTPQGLVSVDPAGVHLTGGIKCPRGTTLVNSQCVNVAVPPSNTPPSDMPILNASGNNLS